MLTYPTSTMHVRHMPMHFEFEPRDFGAEEILPPPLIPSNQT